MTHGTHQNDPSVANERERRGNRHDGRCDNSSTNGRLNDEHKNCYWCVRTKRTTFFPISSVHPHPLASSPLVIAPLHRSSTCDTGLSFRFLPPPPSSSTRSAYTKARYANLAKSLLSSTRHGQLSRPPRSSLRNEAPPPARSSPNWTLLRLCTFFACNNRALPLFKAIRADSEKSRWFVRCFRFFPLRANLFPRLHFPLLLADFVRSRQTPSLLPKDEVVKIQFFLWDRRCKKKPDWRKMIERNGRLSRGRSESRTSRPKNSRRHRHTHVRTLAQSFPYLQALTPTVTFTHNLTQAQPKEE
jgi:hypothetical protein